MNGRRAEPNPKAEAPTPAAEGRVYTCPMHAQIRQVGPGVCPICGMALEPLTVAADSGANPELVDMSRRFWVGLVLTLPVFILEMGPMSWAMAAGSRPSFPMGSSSPCRRRWCCGRV
ncbi:hypothetical protein CSW58_13445, partial [Caulobacter sp. B11]|uniref:heavy metal-binding domain-containing protein n=1 Tax=Caulobacter sp. B11 TaxID=2048899 RepID=UPI000C13697F